MKLIAAMAMASCLWGQSADARVEDGQKLLREKKYAQAEQAFREARQLAPKNLHALGGLVDAQVRQNRSDAALAMLETEVAADPGNAALRLLFGNTAVGTGKYDMAIEAFRSLLPETEGRARGDIYLRLGETYRRKGDLEAAIDALRRADELMPGNVVVISTLGIALDTTGKSEAAMKEYRAVLSIDPNNLVALNNLGYLVADTGGDLGEAMELAKRAQILMPDLAEVADTIGWISFKRGRINDALLAFDGLVQKQPQHSTFHYHLGAALAEKGDRTAAAEQLQAALKCSPPPAEATKIRALLESMQ